MENYTVKFVGDMKDDSQMQNRLYKHYNKWCDIINDHIEGLNNSFDEQYIGKPIEDYSVNEEYITWMKAGYDRILKSNRMDKDLLMYYRFNGDIQLYGIGRYGKRKGKRISFVIKRG